MILLTPFNDIISGSSYIFFFFFVYVQITDHELNGVEIILKMKQMEIKKTFFL